MNEERVLSPISNYQDEEETIRPQFLKDYIGQETLKDNLKIFMHAALSRNEALDHVLLYGPPGLGKTTLSYIIANEMHTNVKICSGPSIDKTGDLAAILTALEPGDVLFIDEIHRLPKSVEEVLYSAMEDFFIDVFIGKDDGVRSIKIDLPPFTLVGATTRAGDLSAPLRDRFGIVSKLEYYTDEQLSKIVERSASVLNVAIEKPALAEIAMRSRGTPRIANRILKRVRDFAQVLNDGVIDQAITQKALRQLMIDNHGLDEIDILYLKCLIERFNGGPVGLETLASAISEEATTLEDMYEPYLLQNGFINRTPRGRVATDKAYAHLNIKKM